MRDGEGCIEDCFDSESGFGSIEPMRSGGGKRRSSKPPVADDGKEYLRPKDIIALKSQPGALYDTLTTLLEPKVRAARNTDGTLECVSQEFGVVMVSFDPHHRTACVYADNCVGNRVPEQYALILAENGFACDIKRGERQNIIASVAPTERYASIHLNHVADDDEVRKLMDTFAANGFDVRLYAGGTQPLATVVRNDLHVSIEYSKGTWQKVAERGVEFLKREGFQVSFGTDAN